MNTGCPITGFPLKNYGNAFPQVTTCPGRTVHWVRKLKYIKRQK